jgi:membrane protease YdiL (CAAX protease family)
METSEIPSAPAVTANGRPSAPASARHLAGFLAIGVAIVALGTLAQHRPTAEGAGSELAQHGQAVSLYVSAIVMDWLLFLYCLRGMRRSGGRLQDFLGDDLRSLRSWLSDLLVAVPFWLLWSGTGWGLHRLLDLLPGLAKSGAVRTVDSLLPHTPQEVLLWLLVCVTAGICEEFAFRGYLQRQFHARAGSETSAVIGQGVVFGLFHAYQGWQNVLVISVLGVLFGILARWRKNLRANMIVHAWADLWEGWLKAIVWAA